MDCPACHGNGELDIYRNSEERGRLEKDAASEAARPERERVAWPDACPVCGGTGYLEQ
ncbi:hypothetical protein [Paenibacillus hamazuiensis]|uniref:hypothetical protein n=1 Tax=Paenibacillus hamazuiensis TaxID=2936508 RepID=UPI00200BC8BB|nr:hypothetical protein [Paenibacillus hamazuiensis]